MWQIFVWNAIPFYCNRFQELSNCFYKSFKTFIQILETPQDFQLPKWGSNLGVMKVLPINFHKLALHVRMCLHFLTFIPSFGPLLGLIPLGNILLPFILGITFYWAYHEYFLYIKVMTLMLFSTFIKWNILIKKELCN